MSYEVGCSGKGEKLILKPSSFMPSVKLVIFLYFGMTQAALGQGPSEPTGPDLYKQHCAACHDNNAETQAPALAALRQISPEAALQALAPGGVMQDQGRRLTPEQQRLIARYITGKEFGLDVATAAKSAFCKASSNELGDPFAGAHWVGWGVDAENSRYQPAEQARLSPSDVPKLKLRWAFAFPGAPSANAQPTVAAGRVFVGAANRTVYSLDAKTACIYWAFEPTSNVRTSIELARPSPKGPWFVYFGDRQGSVYAVDAATGHLIWRKSTEVDSSHHVFLVTGTPKIYDGVVFVPVTANGEVGLAPNPQYECCKFSGAIVALDAATGKQIWRTDTNSERVEQRGVNRSGTSLWGPSGSDIWSSPTVDTKLKVLYVTTGENHSIPTTLTSDAILALDMKTGRILWSHQFEIGDAWNGACNAQDHANCPAPSGPDYDFGSSAILINLPNAKRILIAGQKSGMVYAVDPDNRGALVWQVRVGKGGLLGGVEWGIASDGRAVYVPVSDKDVIDHLPGTPPGNSVGDKTKGGGLFALEVATGKKIWYAPPILCPSDRVLCTPAQLAAATVIPGAVFSGSEDGHIRAYSNENGEILWDFDTERAYDTPNGPGNGGSINGPGAVVVDGVVYVNSGYSRESAAPGNVILAFAPE